MTSLFCRFTRENALFPETIRSVRFIEALTDRFPPDIPIRNNPQTFQRQVRMNRFDLGQLSRDQLRIPTRRDDSWLASAGNSRD